MRGCCRRLAREKAERARGVVRGREELAGAFIVAADTVVARGNRILPKPEHVEEAAQCLRLLSGRGHRVYTGLCIVTPKDGFRERLVETRVSFKHLSRADMEAYLACGEWRGEAGGAGRVESAEGGRGLEPRGPGGREREEEATAGAVEQTSTREGKRGRRTGRARPAKRRTAAAEKGSQPPQR